MTESCSRYTPNIVKKFHIFICSSLLFKLWFDESLTYFFRKIWSVREILILSRLREVFQIRCHQIAEIGK